MAVSVLTGCSSATTVADPDPAAAAVASIVEATALPAEPTTTPTPPRPTPQAASPSSAATPRPSPTTVVTAEPTREQAAVALHPSGAARVLDDPSLLTGRLGLITNRAAVVDGQAVIDLLAEHPDLNLERVFAPEHGLRGDRDAGELVDSETDERTGLSVFSLYGQRRAPTPDELAGLDALVYDLPDVGARYYTYISTMGLAMQAAADAGIAFIVLDRPNLHGRLVEGFVLDPTRTSFVGKYPIPAVYGLTAGELATAIVAEGWLGGVEDLDLRVVPFDPAAASHAAAEAWIAPSPGLATREAALAYPGTVWFEATSLSYGRGTDRAFEQVGAPWLDGDALAAALNAKNLPGVRFTSVRFTPVHDGVGPAPAHAGVELSGVRWVTTDPEALAPTRTGMHLLMAVLEQADAVGVDPLTRSDFLDLLAGGPRLRQALTERQPGDAIADLWSDEVGAFAQRTRRYWLYDD